MNQSRDYAVDNKAQALSVPPAVAGGSSFAQTPAQLKQAVLTKHAQLCNPYNLSISDAVIGSRQGAGFLLCPPARSYTISVAWRCQNKRVVRLEFNRGYHSLRL